MIISTHSTTEHPFDDVRYATSSTISKSATVLVLCVSTYAAVPDIKPESPALESATAVDTLKTDYTATGLDINRVDLKMLSEVRRLAMYEAGWDGHHGQAPSYQAVKDAERFIWGLSEFNIEMPYISLAADGEINFFWDLPHFRLDLGFYGDGTYSYYGVTQDKQEFIEDESLVTNGLPAALLGLIHIA